MRLFGKRTARQKEIRRSRAERRLIWYHRAVEQLRLGPLAFLLFCGVTTGFIVNAGEDALDLHPGQRIGRDITARVAFRLVDERATERLRRQARDNADDYYKLDSSLVQDLRGRLTNVLGIAREQASDPQKLREKAAEIKVVLDDAGVAELVRLADEPASSDYAQAVERALRTLRAQALVEASDLAHRRTGINAVLVDPERAVERPVPGNALLFANNAEHVSQALEAVVGAAGFPAPLRDSIKTSLPLMLRDESEDTFKPLYRYDTERSMRAALDAENRVQTQYNVFAAGSPLAHAGVLTEAQVELLKAEEAAYKEPDLGMQDAQSLGLLQVAPREAMRARWARGFLAFLLVFGFGGSVLLFYGELPGSTHRRLTTTVALLLMLLLARMAFVGTSAPHLAVGAYAFAIALLAITSRRASTYAAGGILALMMTLATRQGVSFLVILVSVAMVAYLGLRHVRHRGRIVGVGLLTGLTALTVTELVGFVAHQDLGYVFWNQAVWAALSTIAAAFIVEGILPAIERLCGVTTNMTLLEWCDPNKPLLRMLAAESPGTYNHSLLVGALADAAAEAIGANGLLARAGAYYHDIGKINKPEYFVENQAGGTQNMHERLSPAMSHLIIIGHVKDGIEMAKEYGLPASLHPFIPEHHGTCVVEYFFSAATRARKPDDPEVSDEQFRYPGPKPQSRETALVMLCDGVEGAVRAMPEPTPNRIEDTVARITHKRMLDGQFDECDLTFRELEIIRSTLVKSLCSLYHARISYPSQEPETEPRQAS